MRVKLKTKRWKRFRKFLKRALLGSVALLVLFTDSKSGVSSSVEKLCLSNVSKIIDHIRKGKAFFNLTVTFACCSIISTCFNRPVCFSNVFEKMKILLLKTRQVSM